MRKNILMLIVLLTITLSLQAQKTPTASEIATKGVATMEKRLKLNSTQKNIIYNYTLELTKDQIVLGKKQKTGAPIEDDYTRFIKKQNETSQSIRNLLKPEQQVEYDLYLEEQLRGGKKKKGKKSKEEEEEVVTGISGLILPKDQ
jgi:protein CpxP